MMIDDRKYFFRPFRPAFLQRAVPKDSTEKRLIDIYRLDLVQLQLKGATRYQSLLQDQSRRRHREVSAPVHNPRDATDRYRQRVSDRTLGGRDVTASSSARRA